MKQEPISVCDLRSLVSHDPEAGTLTWRFRENYRPQWNSRLASTPALSCTNGQGYLHGSIGGKHIMAHRVMWALTHGEWPKGQIDHINGDRSDNRICNLREVTASENQRNRKRPKNNTSGVCGVSWIKSQKKWVAYARGDNCHIHLGTFSCITAAAVARKSAEKKLGYHKNNGRMV